ncbi:MAG: hypothetical protein M0Z94_15160, partial [Dehalococcoidales bacterium]|nr:hypothetical protein [Dehalococcoidales bacterium]
GFVEAIGELLAKASAFGLNVKGGEDQPLVRFLQYPDIEIDPDRVVWELWNEVDRVQPQRVVIDGAGNLERGLRAERVPGMLRALATHLRAKRATVLVTREAVLSDLALTDLQGLPLAGVADNLISMRLEETFGQLRHVMAVEKMRNSAHETATRVYRIGENGLSIEPSGPR